MSKKFGHFCQPLTTQRNFSKVVCTSIVNMSQNVNSRKLSLETIITFNDLIFL